MDLSEIRRLVIVAMFSDDTLFQQLTLKGGNALSLIYGFGFRSSIDVDLSLEGDFVDPEDAGRRILVSLRNRFAEVGIVVFDEKFGKRPIKENPDSERWGGYQAEFKLMEKQRFGGLNLHQARREALVIGTGEQRIFRVQISKYEYTRGKLEHNLDAYAIYVYSPAMIVIEKLRAICQQMDEYPRRQERGISTTFFNYTSLASTFLLRTI